MASSLLTALLIAIATTQVALAISYPSCDPPHRPDNGGYTPYSDKYLIGTKIKFFCNKGYKLHGTSWTICKHIKKSFWLHKSPVCKRKLQDQYQILVHLHAHDACTAIRCSNLDDPRYGKVNVAGTTPKSTAHYTCDYGYKLVGNASRECLYNGYWSGKESVCESK